MDYYVYKDSQIRDTWYQSPSEVLVYIDNDLGTFSPPVPSKFTIILHFRHQNDHFDVPDEN